ncbi:hypothetical protein [Streptomyces sp. NPDC005262]|uniref:hypothetical protein n=1 Tax=Streptomyces sp. NPDC005262 TaxID=3364710 RepID=UPI0036B226E2
MLSSRIAVTTAMALGLAVGLCGTAYADIPDANGVYTGCYNPSKGNYYQSTGYYNQGTSNYNQGTGNLRVIDYEGGERCRRSEVLVTWNEQGQQGPVGPAGPQGATGAQGPAGAGGLTGYEFVEKQFTVEAGTGGSQSFEAPCPAGKLVIGGGYFLFDPGPVISRDSPTPSGDGWLIAIRENSPIATLINVYATCADATS